MRPTVQIHNPSIAEIGIRTAIAFCKAMAVDQLECEGIIATYDGLLDPVLNVVMDTQTTEDQIQEKIAAVFKFYRNYHADWRWIVGPLSKPATLPQYLAQYNLIIYESYPGMYFDLSNKLSTISCDAITIRESVDELHDWVEPISASFQTSDKAEGYRRLNAKIPHGPGTQFRHYVAYHDDQPVSAGTLFIDGDTAMIHNVGTKPSFRNQGFGTAITLRAMQEAVKLGLKHCFLDSSEKGFNLYSHLGFQVYCLQDVYGPSSKLNLSFAS